MEEKSRFWNRERETMAPEERRRFIFSRIREQLDYVYHSVPFYRKLYDLHDVKPEAVRSLPEFTAKVPVIDKHMLREAMDRDPPYGDYLGVDPREIARVQSTSGTTGKPSYLAISQEDLKHIAEAGAMQCWAAGMRPGDTVQIALPLGQFVGGWGLLDAAELIGATVVPVGGRDTLRQLMIMYDIGATVLCTTPSFALYLLEEARKEGYDPGNSPLRLGFFIGEPGAGIPEIKSLIEKGWGIKAIDMGNVAELHPCSNMECEERTGMHVWNDVDYTEIVDPGDPNRPMAMGAPGAIVYTHLWRKAQPMIRYFSGDEATMTDDPCSCGRTYPRFPHGIFGRLDDKLIIRGLSVYPSAIERALRASAGVGLEYRITLSRQGPFDCIRIEAEFNPGNVPETGRAEALRDVVRGTERMIRKYTGVAIPVEMVAPGTFPPAGLKARRVIDRRGKNLLQGKEPADGVK